MSSNSSSSSWWPPALLVSTLSALGTILSTLCLLLFMKLARLSGLKDFPVKDNKDRKSESGGSEYLLTVSSHTCKKRHEFVNKNLNKKKSNVHIRIYSNRECFSQRWSILNLGFTTYSVTFGWTSFGLTQAEGMDELNCFLWSPPDEEVCTSIWSDQVPRSKRFVTILITPFFLNLFFTTAKR